jgi:hypothetical protein
MSDMVIIAVGWVRSLGRKPNSHFEAESGVPRSAPAEPSLFSNLPKSLVKPADICYKNMI